MARLLVACAAFAMFVAVAFAADADPINDYCVGDLKSSVMVNGLPCKAASMVQSSDFLFSGLRKAADTNNPLGIAVTPGFAGVNYPALNSQGLALARFDYAKGGLVPAHTHPRASEVLYVTKGELYVGFVDTAGKLFSATLKKGDVWLFPRGLVHFQLNVGGGRAVSVSVLNGQNPGVQLMASALFGSTPAIKDEVLSKGFGISTEEVQTIKKAFQPAM
jgi:quercetin dioxygenase-like cupin family protein